MNDHKKLFLFQLIAHLGLVYQIIFGNNFSWILTFIVYFFTGCIGMSITYHRLLSHKSWNAPKWFPYIGTLFGSWGLTGTSISWVAIHREHHRFTDTDKDPHSPQFKNFFKVQFLSMFDKPNIRYVPDLLKSKFHTFLHKHYFKGHLIILVSLGLINFDLLISLYLAPAAILWNAGSFINTINHLIGYKNFKTNDKSKNNIMTGFLVWGEGWHNNHHAYPQSFNFGKKWWEFDISSLIIKLLNVQYRNNL